MLTHFESCSVQALGKEPEFSTYKFRESSGMTKRVIDYAFIRQKDFQIVGYQQMPQDCDID